MKLPLYFQFLCILVFKIRHDFAHVTGFFCRTNLACLLVLKEGLCDLRETWTERYPQRHP